MGLRKSKPSPEKCVDGKVKLEREWKMELEELDADRFEGSERVDAVELEPPPDSLDI